MLISVAAFLGSLGALGPFSTIWLELSLLAETSVWQQPESLSLGCSGKECFREEFGLLFDNLRETKATLGFGFIYSGLYVSCGGSQHVHTGC